MFRRLLFMCALAVFFAAGPAAFQGGAAARNEPGRLVGRDGDFEIRYPSKSLVRCGHRDGENPDVWSPEPDCAAPIPVCDSSGHAGNVLACLAYPKAEFKGSELQAAALAVSRVDSFRSEGECNHPERDATDVHGEQMHGIRFRASKSVEKETSYVAEHSIFRVFHASACYELDLNLSMAMDNAFAAEDAPRKLTAAEQEKIRAALMTALLGFRFLK